MPLPKAKITSQENFKSLAIGNESYTLLPNIGMPEGYEGPTSLLGQGAFGTVSIAIDREGEALAIKLIELDRNAPGFEAEMETIQKESAIMTRLGRKNQAVELPSKMSAPNTASLAIVLPLIKGVDLNKYLAGVKDKMEAAKDSGKEYEQAEQFSRALTAMIAAAEAALELQDRNIIHGDLHLGNIKYDPKTQSATILDFGLSQVLQPEQNQIENTDARPVNMHMPPEIRNFQPGQPGQKPRVYDKTTDGYALGIGLAVSADIVDLLPDFAGKEAAEIMKLCINLTQESLIGGNGKPENRINLHEAIIELIQIRDGLNLHIAQKKLLGSFPELQALAKQIDTKNSFKNQAAKNGLPADIKLRLQDVGRQIREHQNIIAKQKRISPQLKDEIIRAAGKPSSQSKESQGSDLYQLENFKKSSKGSKSAMDTTKSGSKPKKK